MSEEQIAPGSLQGNALHWSLPIWGLCESFFGGDFFFHASIDTLFDDGYIVILKCDLVFAPLHQLYFARIRNRGA